MKLAAVTLGNVEMPVLQNARALKTHERLYVHKPKDTDVALKDAEIVQEKEEGEEEEGEEVAPPPSKRTRKTRS